MKDLAKKWASFQEKRSTQMNFWRFSAIGVAITALGAYEYIRKEEQMYLLVIVLGLLTISQTLARYGFALKIQELKDRINQNADTK